MKPHLSAATLVIVTAALLAAPAGATLVMEPVIDHVPGTGPDPTAPVLAFYDPTFRAGEPGDTHLDASHPGDIVTYAAGIPFFENDGSIPPNPVDFISFYNNTNYVITGFTFHIVGPATEPLPFNVFVDRLSPVDAIFGDANADGVFGSPLSVFSDAFISNDGKTMTLSGGTIAPGERFTDRNWFSGDEAILAGIDASFQGYAVPEPATWLLLVLGFGTLGAMLRRSAKNIRRHGDAIAGGLS